MIFFAHTWVRCVVALAVCIGIWGPASANQITITGSTTYTTTGWINSLGQSSWSTSIEGQPHGIVSVSLEAPNASADSGNSPWWLLGQGFGIRQYYPSSYSFSSPTGFLLETFNAATQAQWGYQVTLDKFSASSSNPQQAVETFERFVSAPGDSYVSQLLMQVRWLVGDYTDENYIYSAELSSELYHSSSIAFGSPEAALNDALSPFHFEEVGDWLNYGSNFTVDRFSITRSGKSNSLDAFAYLSVAVTGTASVQAATSVPEPETYTLIVVSLCLLGLFEHRRKNAIA